MNGAHDLGGKHGFGPIDQSQKENFVHHWEETVFGLTLTCGMLGQWNLDQSRFARERTDPAHYLSSTYYEHWLHGLETLLLEQGLVTEEELATGNACEKTSLLAATPERVEQILQTGAPTELAETNTCKFQLDQLVVVTADNPKLHTRLPAYIRGKRGTITHHHGAHVYADEHAKTGTKVAEHLYAVRFEARHLFGDEADNNSSIYVDLFEPYLLSLQDYQQTLNT